MHWAEGTEVNRLLSLHPAWSKIVFTVCCDCQKVTFLLTALFLSPLFYFGFPGGSLNKVWGIKFFHCGVVRKEKCKMEKSGEGRCSRTLWFKCSLLEGLPLCPSQVPLSFPSPLQREDVQTGWKKTGTIIIDIFPSPWKKKKKQRGVFARLHCENLFGLLQVKLWRYPKPCPSGTPISVVFPHPSSSTVHCHCRVPHPV